MSESEKRAKEMEAVEDDCNRTVGRELAYAVEVVESSLLKLDHNEELTSGDIVRMHRAVLRMKWVKKQLK